MKQHVKLTENQLYGIIKESVNKILKEEFNGKLSSQIETAKNLFVKSALQYGKEGNDVYGLLKTSFMEIAEKLDCDEIIKKLM